MKKLTDYKYFPKKKRYFAFIIIGILVLTLMIINARTNRGFYYTPNYPYGNFAFLDNGMCWAGVTGGRATDLDENYGGGYIPRPTTMDEEDACYDRYKMYVNTVVTINDGYWIGVHIGNYMILFQTNKDDVEKNEKYDLRSYLFGHPYYVLKYSGKELNQPEGVLEKWNEMSGREK